MWHYQKFFLILQQNKFLQLMIIQKLVKDNDFVLNQNHQEKYHLINNTVVALVGFIVVIIVISTEAFVLKNYSHVLEYGVRKLMKIPKLLKK